MRWYKKIADHYIVCIGVGKDGEEISKAEYKEIREIIRNRPTASNGYGYRLTESLEWELYELPPVEAEKDLELSDSEALEIIVNGGADNA